MTTERPVVLGLLLAAGQGRRMGRPKALVDDWLAGSAQRLHDGGCTRVRVVLGAEAEKAHDLLRASPARSIVDEVITVADWAEGMGASLRGGLNGPGSDVEGVLVHLVDLPDVGADVVRRVLSAWSGPGTLARAAYGEPASPELGHPVLFGRDHLAGVAIAARGDAGARAYLRDHDVHAVWCGDLAGGADVDQR